MLGTQDPNAEAQNSVTTRRAYSEISKSGLESVQRVKQSKLQKDLEYQNDVLANEKQESLLEATVLPKKSLKESIVEFAGWAPKEVAGLVGSWAALTAVGKLAWYLGSRYYLNTIAKPAAILLVSATFPGAIVPADLIAYAITSPDLLSMAFTTLLMFNKSVPGKYYKEGKDGFLDGWRKWWGIDKKAPANASNWSPASLMYQALDKTGEVLAFFPGAAKLFVGVVSVRALSMAVLRYANNMPLVAPMSSIIADLHGAALFTVMTLLGKEVPETVSKWGEQFAKGRFDDAVYVGGQAANAVYDVGASVAKTGSNAAASFGNGIYNAGSIALSPLFNATRSQRSTASSAANSTAPENNNGEPVEQVTITAPANSGMAVSRSTLAVA